MGVSRLLSDLRVDGFEELLKHYVLADPEFRICVDGGAGLGETAEQMLRVLKPGMRVYAYEPHPANVKAFKIRSDELTLIDAALGASNGSMSFMVTAETAKEMEGGNPFLQMGTSFVGKLVDSGESAAGSFKVPVVRMDASLSSHGAGTVDFAKLDLQGGERDALLGMGEYLKKTKWMWVEYGGQPGLVEMLQSANFTLFDTEYLFVGQPTSLIEELFEITKVGRNSIGKNIFFGFRRHHWANYERSFSFMQKHRRMIQTDMVAINNEYMSLFHDALSSFLTNKDLEPRFDVPEILRTVS